MGTRPCSGAIRASTGRPLSGRTGSRGVVCENVGPPFMSRSGPAIGPLVPCAAQDTGIAHVGTPLSRMPGWPCIRELLGAGSAKAPRAAGTMWPFRARPRRTRGCQGQARGTSPGMRSRAARERFQGIAPWPTAKDARPSRTGSRSRGRVNSSAVIGPFCGVGCRGQERFSRHTHPSLPAGLIIDDRVAGEWNASGRAVGRSFAAADMEEGTARPEDANRANPLFRGNLRKRERSAYGADVVGMGEGAGSRCPRIDAGGGMAVRLGRQGMARQGAAHPPARRADGPAEKPSDRNGREDA